MPTDPDIAALAHEIEGTVAPPQSKGAGDKSADGAGDSTAEKESKPGLTGAGTGDGEGGAGEEEKGEEEEAPDPLKDLNIQQLLAHPALGPMLQSWADRAGAAQVAAVLERERPAIAQTERERADHALWDEHFSSMTQEEIGEEISADSKAASAYAQYQERKQSGGGLSPEAVARASEVYSNAAQVAVYSHMLENSGLDDVVKAELKPENFTHMGVDGLVSWGQASGQAIIDSRVEARAQELLAEKWETHKQEQLAELEQDRPPLTSGRRTGATPDLLGTPSNELLESALSKSEKK